jgi:hypothetical protein
VVGFAPLWRCRDARPPAQVHRAVQLVTGFLKDDVKADAVVRALAAREFRAVEVQVGLQALVELLEVHNLDSGADQAADSADAAPRAAALRALAAGPNAHLHQLSGIAAAGADTQEVAAALHGRLLAALAAAFAGARGGAQRALAARALTVALDAGDLTLLSERTAVPRELAAFWLCGAADAGAPVSELAGMHVAMLLQAGLLGAALAPKVVGELLSSADLAVRALARRASQAASPATRLCCHGIFSPGIGDRAGKNRVERPHPTRSALLRPRQRACSPQPRPARDARGPAGRNQRPAGGRAPRPDPPRPAGGDLAGAGGARRPAVPEHEARGERGGWRAALPRRRVHGGARRRATDVLGALFRSGPGSQLSRGGAGAGVRLRVFGHRLQRRPHAAGHLGCPPPPPPLPPVQSGHVSSIPPY